VMYAGKKIEEAGVIDMFENPMHPYTKGLLNSIPSNSKYRRARRLEAIPGYVPNLLTLGSGCPFANRCLRVMNRCHTEFPETSEVGPNHQVNCFITGKAV